MGLAPAAEEFLQFGVDLGRADDPEIHQLVEMPGG